MARCSKCSGNDLVRVLTTPEYLIAQDLMMHRDPSKLEKVISVFLWCPNCNRYFSVPEEEYKRDVDNLNMSW